MPQLIGTKAHYIKNMRFVDNGVELKYDVASICCNKDGIQLSVRNEGGELYDVNFSETDEVEIVFELK